MDHSLAAKLNAWPKGQTIPATKHKDAIEKLLIFGYFGGRNFGDEVMLLGLIRNARQIGVKSIAIITPTGTIPPHLKGQIDRAYPKQPLGIIRGLIWASSLAFCGGTMFHDAYPNERHRVYRKNLFFLSALCLLGRIMTKHTLLVGVGFGPFHRPYTKLMTWIAASCATSISVRDQSSFHDIALIAKTKNKISLGLDLSISYEADATRNAPKEHDEIVVSIVGAELTSTASTEDVANFHSGIARELSAWMRQKQNSRLLILAIGTGLQDSDLKISAQFRGLIEQDVHDRVDVLAFSGDPRTVINHLATAKAVIATRFHLALVAETLGTQPLWIAYQRKLIDTAQEMGVSETRVVQPNAAGIAKASHFIRNIK